MSIALDEGPIANRVRPGPSLFFTSAIPNSPKAFVGVLHGYADHAARYSHVMQAWAERGIGAVALDLRGHGRALGPRGYCAQFDEYLDDVAELANVLETKAAGRPIFLFGHSFGALVSILSIAQNPKPWRGFVFTNPYLELAMPVARITIAFGKFAARVVPKLAIPSGIDGSMLTHDQARARAYNEDRLVFKTARARWFTETVEAQVRAFRAAPSIQLPAYLVLGASDPIARSTAGKTFFERLGSSDKSVDERPDWLHEILNEPDWRPTADKMADWILARAS